jgi:hypothetical protein
LKRNLNLKSRRYYIEAEYANGVYDESGAQVMRPLSSDEKKWLNEFYGEYVNASLPEGNSMHERATNKARVRGLNAKLNGLRDKYQDSTSEERVGITREIVETKDDLHYADLKKNVYGANNARNRDLYNVMHRTGKLVEVDPAKLDIITPQDLYDYCIRHSYTESSGLFENAVEDSNEGNDDSAD